MSTDSGNRKYQALALGTSYALGTFNDNFFKQAGLLLAVTTGNAVFQSQVTFLFALPFVLFSAWSGWLADRFAKKSLVICAKTLELAAMLAGAWGMVTLDWNWMLAMTFCMGLSSTLFSPALNHPRTVPRRPSPPHQRLVQARNHGVHPVRGIPRRDRAGSGMDRNGLPLRPLAGGDIGRDRRGRGACEYGLHSRVPGSRKP